MGSICTSIVATLVLAGAAFAATINVPADYATIQGAVDAAADGDEVVVAPGTYTSTVDPVVNMLGKAITLRASGTPEETIIDGQDLHRGIICDTNETDSTVINGFTITGGFTNYSGGGIVCNGSSPTLTECTISGNTADKGGGISCWTSNPTLTNCTISGNTANENGGGMFNDTSSPTLDNCTFENNSVNDGDGGGMWNDQNSSPALQNCLFTNNTCDDNGGGMRNRNGSNPTLTDCVFTGNTATINGGAMHNYLSSPSLTNCTFTQNLAADGGGIYCSDSSPTITDCTILSNTAGGGGGIYCYLSSPTITGCTISGNTTNDDGGGIYCYESSSPTITGCTISGNTANDDGGGIYCAYSSSPTITNCTISDNTAASYGGGIGCYSSSPTLTGCTISDNTANDLGGGVHSYNSSNPTLTDTLLCGNAPDAIYGPWTDGGGVSFYDDCFTDCNGNSIPDSEDIANGTSYDCDQNGVPDECQSDCDGDGWIDACDSDPDCDGDGVPDNCETDCNTNGIPDGCEIDWGIAQDCNANGIPDECDIANDPSLDCDGSEVLDSCEIEDDQSLDCNGNGTLDECDLGGQAPEGAVQWTVEEGGNGHWYAAIPLDQSSTELDMRQEAESLGATLASISGAPEDEFVRSVASAATSNTALLGGMEDLEGIFYWLDGTPFEYTNWDATQPDGTASGEYIAYYEISNFDAWHDVTFTDSTVTHFMVEFAAAVSGDCNVNGIPDECDIADGTSNDVNGNGIPDECEGDCNANGVPDHWDIKTGTSEDCNANGIPDECDITDGTSNDVNGNSIPDECEADCNDNGSPDDWDVVMGWSEDCNDNLIPDECELAAGESPAEGAVQWTVEEGGNGHWYEYNPTPTDWHSARSYASQQGGDLASISSVEENVFIHNLVPHSAWIGGTDEVQEGDWHWSNGDTWDYTNWESGEPNNNDPKYGEDYTYIVGYDHPGGAGFWYDGSVWTDDIAFVIEWEAGSFLLDCNANGILDECDIADETSNDINGDGVPDECQCFADIDGSGAVTIDDLLAVIGYWGSSIPAGDLNSDGTVDIEDLLIIFDQWGPCP